MKDKIKLWIDKKDIEIKCTEDKIINITGMIGAGKSTEANKYRNNNNYIVISLDCLYRGQDKGNLNEETIIINKILQKKLPNKDKEEYFKEYYYEIIKYINSVNKPVIWVLEGQHIYRYLSLKDIKGIVIVKRTCLINCWIRSIMRHIKKKKIKLKNNEITKRQYRNDIWNLIKKRTKQVKYYQDLNKFLYEISDSIDNKRN